MAPHDRYAARGVSSSKEEVLAAVAKLDPGLFPGAFCKVVPDLLGGDPNYCVVMHADGAGTKSALAYAYWRQTGNMQVWAGIAQDAIVMNLDDLLCVGICSPILLSSTIGRNKRLIPGAVVDALIAGTEAFCAQMRTQGIDIQLTGGETADVGDLVRTVIVDSTVVARAPRAQIITNQHIAPGDVAVGLCSYGQATYENAYNGGMGSNGLTSARHDLFNKSLAARYPETFDPALPPDLTYVGPFALDDRPAGLPVDVGQLALSPTRTYAPIIRDVLQAMRPEIHAIIHCSGGAQTKVLHAIHQLRVVKDNLFPVPPLFALIQQHSHTPWQEMYKTYNMGHRMEIYVRPQMAEEIIQIAAHYGVPAQVIGHCEALPTGPEVQIRAEHGVYTYTL